jgi:hypothetical protein
MTPPKFVARRKLDGSWFIEVTWPNGRREEVPGFSNAAEADIEIKIRLDAFHEGTKRYQSPHPASFVRALEGRKTVS